MLMFPIWGWVVDRVGSHRCKEAVNKDGVRPVTPKALPNAAVEKLMEARTNADVLTKADADRL